MRCLSEVFETSGLYGISQLMLTHASIARLGGKYALSSASRSISPWQDILATIAAVKRVVYSIFIQWGGAETRL